MRPELAAMRLAGMIRSRFSARFGMEDHRGFIVLNAVQTPIGEIDHLWVRPGHWHGDIPARGAKVNFRAQIEPYYREDGSEDLGLFRLWVIEE